jgi:hypothetical protein
MFNAKLSVEPLFVVIVLHVQLTQLVAVQVLPVHTVPCVVFCVRAIADVNISTIVRLDTSVSRSAAVAAINNNLFVFIGIFLMIPIIHVFAVVSVLFSLFC